MTEESPKLPESAKAPSSFRKRLVQAGMVLVLILAVGLGIAGWEVWTGLAPVLSQLGLSQLGPRTDLPDLDRLRRDLAQTKAELTETRDQFDKGEHAPPPPPPVDPSAQLAQLDARIERLEKTGADAALVLRLADRLDRIEAQLRDLEVRHKGDVAEILAIGLLRDALDAGRPFDGELRVLKALATNDADIAAGLAQLKAKAIVGIPTRPILTERFFKAESALVRADALPLEAEQSWQSQALDRLLSVVSIHREDGALAGASVAAIVARAHADLVLADLAGAVHELDKLTGAPAQAAQDWLGDAKARLSADQMINDWSAQAVAAAGAKL